MMLRGSVLIFIIVAIVSIISPIRLYAGANSFQIAPAPVPYPKYELGSKRTRVTVTYLGMEGSGLSLVGGGFNIGGRTVPEVPGNEEKPVAVDGMFGMYVLGGDYTSTSTSNIEMDMTLMVLNPQFDVEYQFIKKDKYSLIGFAGFSLPFYYGSVSGNMYVLGTTTYISVSMTSLSYTIPFGVQGGIYPHKDWTLMPFFFINWTLGGSVSTTSRVTGTYASSSTSTSDSMDSFMATSFGMDVVYEPWDLSLGSLLQSVDGGGEAGAIETTMFQLSWVKKY